MIIFKFILILIIILSILIIFISLIILLYLTKKINTNLFYNDYKKSSIQCLNKYGDFKIKKLYLVKKPLENLFHKLVFKIFSLFKFQNYPNHIQLVCIVKSNDNKLKHIMIEKNNGISISTDFSFWEKQELLELKIKKKYTINILLNLIKKDMGKDKFFNYCMYKNNCQTFILSFLKVINNMQYKNFVWQDHFQGIWVPEYMIDLGNISTCFFSFIESIIFDIKNDILENIIDKVLRGWDRTSDQSVV